VIDAKQQLLMSPLVDPHIHLDAVLTAGEPEWNMSGTLFEGIERWAQRKASITFEDTNNVQNRPSTCWWRMASSMCVPMSTLPIRN
jgi:cytosine/adenosine deaminase-related metal-dependent hydrolase